MENHHEGIPKCTEKSGIKREREIFNAPQLGKKHTFFFN